MLKCAVLRPVHPRVNAEMIQSQAAVIRHGAVRLAVQTKHDAVEISLGNAPLAKLGEQLRLDQTQSSGSRMPRLINFLNA